VYAQLGGLDYIDEIGVPAIRRVTSALTEDLVARAREYGFQPKVASRAEDRSAIVMLPAADPAAGVRHLAAGRIIADARPGHVRLSPFFYNVQDDHVSALERFARHTGHLGRTPSRPGSPRATAGCQVVFVAVLGDHGGVCRRVRHALRLPQRREGVRVGARQ